MFQSVLNNSSNFSGNKMLRYNFQEYSHHVFMLLKLILKSLLVSCQIILFLHLFLHCIDIATQRCSGK